MTRFKITILLILLLSTLQVTAWAASFKIPLRKLAPIQDVRLQGTKDSYRFSVPIPKRWTVRNATFHFKYTNSSALIPLTSRLVFLVHNQPLAQIRLNPDVPVGEVVLKIPGDLLKAGYNPCQILVSQHYTIEECEDPFSPELWTWINLDRAYFKFDVKPEPVPRNVSAISNFLFDPRNIFGTTVNLIIPDLTPAYVKLASLVASGISLRYNYRPVDFNLSKDIQADCDNILIGTEEEVRKFLNNTSTVLDGPVISIHHLPMNIYSMATDTDLPSDPYKALITLSGSDQAELEMVVKAFASVSYPFPDSPRAKIADLELPTIEPRMLKNGLLPGNSYSLASLGMESVLFKGISPPPADINLRLPSDLYLSPNKFASVVLHMAYDAALRSDSVLNLKLNGKFITGIQLDNPRGDYFKGYTVNLPLSAFRPGSNRLTFEAVLTPLHTDKCTLIQTENLRLTLFGDSMLSLPDVPYWIKMPKMGVFFEDAFPFGKWPDLRETMIALTEKTFSAANAAVNIIAICAQKIGYPPFGLACQFSLDPPHNSKDVFMFGSLQTIPENIVEHAPLGGINPTQYNYQHLGRPKSTSSLPTNFWSKIAKDLSELPRNMSDYVQAATVKGHIYGEVASGRAALMQFQHPKVMGRTIMLLTAANGEDLIAGSKTIWDPAVQAACRGDLAFIDLQAPQYETLSVMVGPSYFLGKPSPVPVIENLINAHPVIFLMVLLLVLILFLGLILKMLKRMRKKRTATANA